MTKPKIYIYLEKKSLGADLTQSFLILYDRIRAIGEWNEIDVEFKLRTAFFARAPQDELDDFCDDGNLHIVDDGFKSAPGMLNSGLAYINGFWHLDPKGVRFASSIADETFVQNEIKFKVAKTFFDELRERHVHQRVSRYAQQRDVTKVPSGGIAVFFQGTNPKSRYKCTTFNDIDMLRAVVDGSTDEVIWVKTHPQATHVSDLIELAELRAKHPRVKVTGANVHDILAAVDVVVSINSSVSIEGFMHRKPAIHFGDSDLSHHSQMVKHPSEFKHALQRAYHMGGGYAQFLYWYYKQHCLEIRHKRLHNQIWKKFTAAGFPRSRFGLVQNNAVDTQ